MTKVIHWYYSVCALTLGFLFIGAGLLFWQYSALAVLTPAENLNNILGWAWSGNTGWISLNSENCAELNKGKAPEDYICNTTPNVDYGVRLLVNQAGTGGEIKGYAWSENLGWICFGQSCMGTPPSGSLTITFVCQVEIEGIKQTVSCDTQGMFIPQLSGWAKILNLADQGWIKLSGTIGAIDSYGVNLILDDPDDDEDYSRLVGWMWHNAGGTTSNNAYGVGWICLGDDQRCTFNNPEILFPYLRAEGGDIFAKRISTFFPPPKDIHNAQYLIQVLDNPGISPRFTSECKEPRCKQFGAILEIPSTDPTRIADPYNFKLGRFDFKGLVTPIPNTNLNRYNYIVKRGSPNFTTALNNKVYHIDSDYTINNSQVIKNGDNNTSGAGTIVIDGDLIINNNINYQPNPVDERSKLASVVWIVMGDVIIDPNVTKVAGSFIVLGQRKADMETKLACANKLSDNYRKFCPAVGSSSKCGDANDDCAEMPKCLAFDQNDDIYSECGWFKTGQGSDNPLTVYGSVFARQFKLERTYIDSISRSAAEKFIVSGRLQLNPPPGLADFAKGLPNFRRQ